MTKKEESVLEKAICFAVHAHSGQKRKVSGSPYILHPLEAAQIAASMTNDEDILAAVVLHDTVEDCGVDPAELKEKFGDRVFCLVMHETEDKMRDIPASDSWEARKGSTLGALKETHDIGVKIMWLSDKLSNLRSICYVYQTIGDEIWKSFNQKDKSRHEWYYRTAAEYLSDLSDTPAYKELTERIKAVFG